LFVCRLDGLRSQPIQSIFVDLGFILVPIVLWMVDPHPASPILGEEPMVRLAVGRISNSQSAVISPSPAAGGVLSLSKEEVRWGFFSFPTLRVGMSLRRSAADVGKSRLLEGDNSL
jgi:hypothetical protein